MQWTSHCVPWQIEFVGVLFGLWPRFCCVWFSVVCFAVSSGETQVWLGDLRVVVFVVFCGFCVVCFDLPAQNGHFLSLYKCLSDSLCSCKDRAFSATSAKLEGKKNTTQFFPTVSVDDRSHVRWTFANPSFELDLHRIKVTHADQPIVNVSGEPAETQDRCSLYSVLTGLLRGKPLRMLRQIEGRNGFEVWRQLVQLFQPKTKSRAISTLSALMNIPGFTQKDRTLLDQILVLERLRTEYVMLSVLVRALPKAIQQHIQLQMHENSTCAQVVV